MCHQDGTIDADKLIRIRRPSRLTQDVTHEVVPLNMNSRQHLNTVAPGLKMLYGL